MKKLIILSLSILLCSTFVTSCSSSKVDEIKNEVALKAERAVVKELKEAYAGVEIVGHDCDAEADMIGEKVYDKIADVLQIEARKKSVVGSLVPVICEAAVDFLPELVADDADKYACLRRISGDKLEKVGKDLCSAIDL